MFRFLFGVVVGILISFLFLYFGGGKTLKKVGTGITETGKKMEAIEEVVKKEQGGALTGVIKKMLKDENGASKEGQ